ARTAPSAACVGVAARAAGAGAAGGGPRAGRVVGGGAPGAADPAAPHGVAGGAHVGLVDQGGVDLAQPGLGQRGLDVLLLGGGVDLHAGGVHQLLGGGAARHLRRAHRDGDPVPGQVVEALDAGRVVRRHGDLQHVAGEDLRVALGEAALGYLVQHV